MNTKKVSGWNYFNVIDMSQVNNRMQKGSDEFRLYNAETGKYITVQRSPKKDEFKHSSEQISRHRDTDYRKRLNQRQKNKRNNFIKRAAAGLAAAGIITGGIASSNIIKGEKENISTIPEETPIVTQSQPEGSLEDKVQTIFITEPEVLNVYDKLTDALNRFSEQLGVDGLELIKDRVNEIGDGKVNVIDVLKILWIESRGKVYDENGDILSSYTSQAYGPFQLTPDTVDYLNNYYGLTGTENELDVMNPYDNLDACIYDLKFLKDKKENDLIEQGVLPTGTDIMRAVFWGYHDGAWAKEITQQGEDYLQAYDELSIIDNHDDVVQFLINA